MSTLIFDYVLKTFVEAHRDKGYDLGFGNPSYGDIIIQSIIGTWGRPAAEAIINHGRYFQNELRSIGLSLEYTYNEANNTLTLILDCPPGSHCTKRSTHTFSGAIPHDLELIGRLRRHVTFRPVEKTVPSEWFESLSKELTIDFERAIHQRDEYIRTEVSTASHGGSHDTCTDRILLKALAELGIQVTGR